MNIYLDMHEQLHGERGVGGFRKKSYNSFLREFCCKISPRARGKVPEPGDCFLNTYIEEKKYGHSCRTIR